MNQYNDKEQQHGYWEEDLIFVGVTHKGSYINGKRDGLFMSFNRNSKVLNWTGYFKNDKEIGFWRVYDEGKLYETEFYL
jgi:antitoxin component YwqK of YwqJK toxin-antitoxin module